MWRCLISLAAAEGERQGQFLSGMWRRLMSLICPFQGVKAIVLVIFRMQPESADAELVYLLAGGWRSSLQMWV